MVALEVRGEEVLTHPIAADWVQTNHRCRQPGGEAAASPGSRARHGRACELMAQGGGALKLEAILADTVNRPHAIFAQSGDVNRTLETLLLDPLQRRARTRLPGEHWRERQAG